MHTGVCNLYFQIIKDSFKFENLNNQTILDLGENVIFANSSFQMFANYKNIRLTFINVLYNHFIYKDLNIYLCMVFILYLI